jgi:hypothetical protein
VERCAQFESRAHPDPVWGSKGILQYDMAIEALKTQTRIDTETRTLESAVDLKGSRLKTLPDIDPEVKVKLQQSEWRELQELEKVCISGYKKLNNLLPIVKQKVSALRLSGEVVGTLPELITSSGLLMDNICDFGAACKACFVVIYLFGCFVFI